MEKRYTIGEMAQLCNVSIKALRFYDQEGIVKPEERDAGSGYRYYSEKQLLQLLIIKELKPLGFSLSEIRNFLLDKDLFLYRKKLMEKFAKIESDILDLQTQLRIMKNISQNVFNGISILKSYEEIRNNNADNPYIIKTEQILKMPVVYTRYTCEYNAADLFLERLAEIQKIRDQYGFFSCGPLMAIFHEHYTTQFFSSTCDLEVFLPIINEEQGCSVVKQFGGFLGATTIHIGRYSDMLAAYLVLVNWIDNQGFQIDGPAIEQYIVDPKNTDSEEKYVTKIIFPIKKARRGKIKNI
jgi:DNA-binding transcriptional MerR regulator/effector-binding domain-containing protein